MSAQDMWGQFTAGAKKAGDSVAKAGEKAKLQSENLLLKRCAA